MSNKFMDREMNKLTPERMKEIMKTQKRLSDQRAKEEEMLNKLKSSLGHKIKKSTPAGKVPPMPKYGGTPRGEDKSPEERKMEALIHLQNRQESKALGEAKRRANEEFESGYKKRN